MSDIQHFEEIARLIAMEVSDELSAGDMRKLMAWVDECPDNRRLYSQIKNSTNFNARNLEYQKIDVQAGWKAISPVIEKRRNLFSHKTILKYAATILLPLLIVSGIYFYSSWRANQRQNIIAHTCKIHPGSTKAVLILNNGESVVLDSSNNESIREKDGTIIQKSDGKLNYSNPSNEETVQPIYNTINIPRGGEYNLVLADGTRVYLNAMSSFKYPVKFSGKNREVELSGEAYFQVTKDASRPFVVKTSAINIEVLGTSFNLNAYENTERIVTTLVEGSVKIDSHIQNGSRLLVPEEQAIFDIKSGLTEIKKVDVNLYTAWKDGNFIFYDTRLEEIMTTLTRWYNANVFYTNASVKNLRFSGNLNRYDDINQLLDIIKSTGKINIEIKNKTIQFSERN